MKRTFRALAFLATLTCATLSAQTATLSANIPFSFRTGTTLMPAGEYTFYQSGAMLLIQSRKGGHAAMTLTQPAWHREAATEGKVQFTRYGDAYFLSGLWTPNSKDGLSVPQSSKEKELARRFGTPQPAAVALARH